MSKDGWFLGFKFAGIWKQQPLDLTVDGLDRWCSTPQHRRRCPSTHTPLPPPTYADLLQLFGARKHLCFFLPRPQPWKRTATKKGRRLQKSKHLNFWMKKKLAHNRNMTGISSHNQSFLKRRYHAASELDRWLGFRLISSVETFQVNE